MKKVGKIFAEALVFYSVVLMIALAVIITLIVVVAGLLVT